MGTPFAGSIDAFARRIVSFQSAQAYCLVGLCLAKIVSDSLQAKFDSETGVSIDEECEPYYHRMPMHPMRG